jgi:ankyrin repeat protein
MRRLLLAVLLALVTASPAAAGFYDLLNAARANDTALARMLVEAGTEPNGGPSGFPDSYSPLQWAAQHGNIELMQLLLDAGADTERRDFNGDRPLQWAARAGQAGSIMLLVAAGSPVNSADDRYGVSPLHLAARSGYPAAVRILILAGADLDAADQSNGTALHEAALIQEPETVRLLLEAGADPDIAGDILQETALHIAAARQEASIVRLLLAAGATPIGWDSDGSDPLHIAAFRGLPDHVAALLEAGADPLALDDEGLTPLQSAIAGKRHEVWDNDAAALLLVPFAGDVTATFLAAAEAGLPETARALLARRADPNAVAADGTSALAHIVRIGGLPGEIVLEVMFKFGVDLSRFGIEALAAAAEANNISAAGRLLEFGLPVDGDANWSPLLVAAQAGSVEMVGFLLSRGATPVDPARVRLAELTPLELFALERGERSAALDTTGTAIRERLEALRTGQLAARALLAAAIGAR